MKNISKKQKIFYCIIILCIFIISMSVTYAYFRATITGSSNDQIVTTGSLRLSYVDGPYIELNRALPGQGVEKELVISNTGTYDTEYSINWKNLVNEIINDELVVSFTCKRYSDYFGTKTEIGTCESMLPQPVGNSTEVPIKANIPVEVGITHEYSIKIEFIETSSNQNYNQGKVFAGELSINEYQIDNLNVPLIQSASIQSLNLQARVIDNIGIVAYSVVNAGESPDQWRTISSDKSAEIEDEVDDYDKYLWVKNQSGTIVFKDLTPQGTAVIDPNGGEFVDDNISSLTPNDYTISKMSRIFSMDRTVGPLTYLLKYKQTVDIPEPEREGYSFDEWNVVGERSIFSGNTFVMGIENTTATAQWSVNSYELTIDPNGGKWENSENNQTFTINYGDTKDITIPVKSNNTFGGWELSEGTNSSLESSTFIMGSANCTLTAIWIPNNYSWIAFHNQQNIGNNNYTRVNYDTRYGNAPINSEITPVVNTYTGFTSPSSQTITINSNLPQNNSNVVNYNYTRNTYDITYDLDGGTATGNPTSLKYNQTYNLNIPSRYGSNFTYWTVSGAGSSVNGTTFTMGSENVVLKANYTLITYTLSFNGNGGTSPSDRKVTFGSKIGNLIDSSRTGYTFDGWYTSPSGGTKITSDSIANGSNTYYAHWNAIESTITFNNQGATTSGTTNLNISYDQDMPHITVPTKTDEIFAGYFSEENGKGIQYYNANGDSIMKYNKTNSITLYAMWYKKIKNRILSDNTAYADNTSSPYVSSATGINYSQPSSDTNGKGLYYTTDTTKTENGTRVYFYRGNINNNYIVLGKYCWKIVRTVENGSIKLVFYGNYLDNKCYETPNNGITSKWNITNGDNAYIGYMMGIDNKCLASSTNSCTNTTPTTSKAQAQSNTYSSLVKNVIDAWYSGGTTNKQECYRYISGAYQYTNCDYTSNSSPLINEAYFIADTPYCNDRSISSHTKLAGYTNSKLGYGANYTLYGAEERIFQQNSSWFPNTNVSPTYKCAQNNDKFTVSSSNGNGALTYPIALLTVDEAIFAGLSLENAGTGNNFLITTKKDILMSSVGSFRYDNIFHPYTFFIDSTGEIKITTLDYRFTVHPVVSLVPSTMINAGSGVLDDPYIIASNSFNINNNVPVTSSRTVNLNFFGNNVSTMCVSNTNSCENYEPFSPAKIWTLTEGEGSKTVYVFYKDSNGNLVNELSKVVNYKINIPTSTIQIDAGTSRHRTLTLYSPGATKMCFSNTSDVAEKCSVWETYRTSFNRWSLSSGLGEKKVYAFFKNNDGYISNVASATTVVTTLGPSNNSIRINAGDGYERWLILESWGASKMCISNTSNLVSDCTSWESYSTSKLWTLSDGLGQKTVYAFFKDSDGYISDVVSARTEVTVLGPPINNSIIISNATGRVRTLTLSSEGATKICLSNTSAVANDCTSWFDYVTSRIWILSEGLGEKTVYAFFKDEVGNISEAVSATTNVTILGPTNNSVSINEGTGRTRTLSLSSTNASQMCISNTSNVASDCTSWKTYNSSYVWSLSSGLGEKTIYVFFKDKAGDVSDAVSATTTVTVLGPTDNNISISEGEKRYRTLTLSSKGATKMCFSNTSNVASDCTSWKTYNSSYVWNLSSGLGEKTVYAFFKDSLGNISEAVSATANVTILGPINNSISISEGIGRARTLTLNSTGATKMCISNTSNLASNCTTWVAYNTSKIWNLNSILGENTVYAFFKDSSGDISDVVSATTSVTSIGPANNSVIISNGTGKSRNLTLSSNGATKMCFSNTSNDSSKCKHWIDYTSTYSWVLSNGTGTKNIYAFFKDAANDISPVINVETIVENSKETVFEYFADSVYDDGLVVNHEGSYPWVYNSYNERFESNNKNINLSSSVSIISFVSSSNNTLSFDYGVSSEYNYDKLTITLTDSDNNSNVLVNAIHGVVTGSVNVNLENNKTYYLEMSYVKDQLTSKNEDVGYIDNIEIKSNLSPIENNSISISEGEGRVRTLTLNSDGATEMCFSNSSSESGDCKNWIEYSNNYYWLLSTGSGEKTVYAFFRDEFGNISDAVSDTTTLDSYNEFVDENFTDIIYDSNIMVNGSGSYPWVVNTTSERLESNNIEINSSRSISLITLAPSVNSILAFDYGVSSEASYDKLTITLTGDDSSSVTIANAISGVRSGSANQILSAGVVYTLTLTYTKDSGVNRNDDVAWIDNLRTSGGGDAPTNNNILISEGTGRERTLTLSSTNAEEMCFSETSNDPYHCNEWINYSTNYDITLSTIAGIKTVYAFFRNEFGYISEPVSATTTVTVVGPQNNSISISEGRGRIRTLTLSSDDAVAMCFSNTSNLVSNCINWVPYSVNYSWILDGGHNTGTVYAFFADSLGDVSRPVIATTTITDSNEIIEDFSDTTYDSNIEINSNSDYPWIVNADSGRFESSNIRVNNSTSTSTIVFSASDRQTLLFNYGILSQNINDRLSIMLIGSDGSNITLVNELRRIYSGNIDINLVSGVEYTLSLTYTKGDSEISGNGFAWIDNFVLLYDEFAPTNNSISISEEMGRARLLTLSSTGATEMCFSNTSNIVDDCTSWKTYNTTYPWILSPGLGEKTVYAFFKDSFDNISDAINVTTEVTALGPQNNSISIDDGTGRARTLTLGSTGATKMCLSNTSNNVNNCTIWDDYSTNVSWILSPGLGEKTIYVFFKDDAGDISEVESTSVTVDVLGPQNNSISITEGTGRARTLNIASTNAAEMCFSNTSNIANDCTNWYSYRTSYSWSLSPGLGEKTVYAFFKDYSGDISQVTSATASVTIVGPINNSISIGAGTGRKRTLTLSSTGASQMCFSNTSNNSNDCTNWYSYRTSYSWALSSELGEKTVYAFFKDASGDISSVVSAIAEVTTIGPQNNSISIGAGTGRTRTLTLSSTGASQMCFSNTSNNSNDCTNWRSYRSSYSWTLSSGIGEKIVYAFFKDSLGDISSVVSATTEVTTIGPTNNSISISDGTGRDRTLTLSSTGASQMCFSNTSNLASNCTSWYSYRTSYSWVLSSGTGNKTVYAFFKSSNGEISEAVSTTTEVTTIGPQNNSIAIGEGTGRTRILTLSSIGATRMCFSNTSDDASNCRTWQYYSENYQWLLSSGTGNKNVYAFFMDSAGDISQVVSATTTVTNYNAEINENFNDNVINDNIILEGWGSTYSWSINNNRLESNSIGVDSSYSDISLKFDSLSNNVVSFDYGISSEQYRDILYIYLYNEEFNEATLINAISGEENNHITFGVLPNKNYELYFSYQKDSSNSDNLDLAYIDNFSLENDTVPPTNNNILISNGTGRMRTLTLSSTDATKMCFSNTSNVVNDCTIWVDYSTSYNWILGSGEGSKTVYAFFKDVAGNISDAVSATTSVDGTSNEIIEDFSDTTYEEEITINGGDSYPWEVNIDNERFESTNVGIDSSLSSSTITFESSTNNLLYFDYGVSSEFGYDKLYVLLVDEDENETYLLNGISGDDSGSVLTGILQNKEYSLSLIYEKDDSSHEYDDIAWIDNFFLSYDNTPPTNNSISISDGTGKVRILTLGSTGATKMCFSNTSDVASDCTTWVNYNNSYVWYLSNGEGVKTVYAFFKDAAGNISSVTSATTSVTGTSNEIIEEFTDTTINDNFIVDAMGSYPWLIDTENGRFVSSNYDVDSSSSISTITFNPSTDSTLSFDYGVSSEVGYDELTITLTGDDSSEVILVSAISGEDSGTVIRQISAGVNYTIIVDYTKDSSSYENDDIGWIDNLVIQ